MKNSKFAKLAKKSLRKQLKHVEEHREEFSVSNSFFTRARKWSLHQVLHTMFFLLSDNLHTALYRFAINTNMPSSFTLSSFIQQRDKLELNTFQYIFSHVLQDLLKAVKPKTFHGYHLLACDGSDFPMPSEVIPSAPDADVQRKVQHHMLHLNALYDVPNGLYVAVNMAPKLTCNERSSLLDLVQALSQDCPTYKRNQTIITCDRGYEGRNVFFKLHQSGYHFVIRAKPTKGYGILHNVHIPLPVDNEIVDVDRTFTARKNPDGIYRGVNQSVAGSGPVEELSLRVVAVSIGNGKYEYLITNLPREKMSKARIVEIYRKRWDIEVSFRYLKYGVSGIVFHAKNLKAQQMELYTTLTLYNCISFIANNQTNIPRHTKGYRRKINFSAIVLPCIEYILFDRRVKINLDDYIAKQITWVKEGRRFDRNMRRKPPCSFQYRTV